MLHRRHHARQTALQLQRHLEDFHQQMAHQTPPMSPAPQAPQPVHDDFLPQQWRIPRLDELGGRMMPRSEPLVLDGEIVTCATCGSYRGWIILSTHDQIWLRCRAGHQQHEIRLDTAWYNRHAGPPDATHATFEDCLRHLGQ